MGELRGFRDLQVYCASFSVAMEIFRATKSFSKDERFSLTDQIRRSSRSVAANIAEAFRKRQYPAMFVSKLADADAEAAETQVWLDFSKECGYLDAEQYEKLILQYEEVGKMLGSMMKAPERFVPRKG